MIRTPVTAVVGVTLDLDDVKRLDAAAARNLDTRAAYIRKTILQRLREDAAAPKPEPASCS